MWVRGLRGVVDHGRENPSSSPTWVRGDVRDDDSQAAGDEFTIVDRDIEGLAKLLKDHWCRTGTNDELFRCKIAPPKLLWCCWDDTIGPNETDWHEGQPGSSEHLRLINFAAFSAKFRGAGNAVKGAPSAAWLEYAIISTTRRTR